MLLTEGFLGWGFLGKTKGFIEQKALRFNVHTLPGQTEGLKVGLHPLQIINPAWHFCRYYCIHMRSQSAPTPDIEGATGTRQTVTWQRERVDWERYSITGGPGSRPHALALAPHQHSMAAHHHAMRTSSAHHRPEYRGWGRWGAATKVWSAPSAVHSRQEKITHTHTSIRIALFPDITTCQY